LRAAAVSPVIPVGDDRVENSAADGDTALGDPGDRVEIRPIRSGTARLRARYAEVHALSAAGCSLKAIRRQTGLARPTIRKHLRATS
jgi:DNA-binding NarL/FixJ family response regulator